MSKRLLRSKRGMAMESAILFMLIIFSLCALLSAVTLTGHYQNKLEQQLLESKTKIDQFGEWFLAGALKFDENGEGKRDGYHYYRTDADIPPDKVTKEVTTGEATTTTETQIFTDFYLAKEDSNTVLLHIMTVTTTTTTTTTTVQTDENGETSTKTTSTQTTLLSWLYSGMLPTITDNSQD